MNRLDLCGKWMLSNSLTRKEIKDIPMNIPGDVHSALLRKKIIPDPYYAFNEKDTLWVGNENWKISKTFTYRKEAGTSSFLVFDSADTIFTVTLNGKKAGAGDNYFRIWRFDVSSLLKDGDNTIEIEFFSAEKAAAAIAKKLPYTIPCNPAPVFSPNRNLIRKIQCHAGWDWGPCLMVCGIYGSIGIETVQNGYIESVSVNTKPLSDKEVKEISMNESSGILSTGKPAANKKDSTGSSSSSIKKQISLLQNTSGTWEANISIRYFALKAATIHFMVELTGNNKSAVAAMMKKVVAGDNKIETSIQVENPVLWKSADELRDCGEKENSLYTLTVTALAEHTQPKTNASVAEKSSAARTSFPKEDSIVTKHIGFRTLVLSAKKDKDGCSLYYCLNGRPLFAKGANWVPVDSLPERCTKERYEYLLQSAVDANMNSMRFWGGGQYESDMCYDICDRLGIIIWQDCMFACSLYPATDDFLSNVEQELKDTIYRLQSHPSLAVWCGNNEDFGSLNWFKESRDSRDRYIVDYDRLNHGAVEKMVKLCDPERTWWPSSPCAGPETFGDNWHNDSEGDMHFWSVWHERKSFEAYLEIKPRFVSEFGYESFPSLEGVKEYAPDGDYSLTGPVMEYHQRSPGGNSIMIENFTRYFRFPEGTENMLYLSQVQQAVAVKTAVQYWRSLRPHCMGATYWQLNDVWPVASWSSIEYSGKWKLLQYSAKNFFSPLTFSLIKKQGMLSAHIVNDSLHDVQTEVTLTFYSFDGKVQGKPVVIKQNVASDTACSVWEMADDKLPLPKEQCFVYGEMKAFATTADTAAKASIGSTIGTSMKQNAPVIITDTLFPSLQKQASPCKAKITTSVAVASATAAKTKPTTSTVYTITLTTDKPTFYTSLDVPGVHGIFSDNMFTLLPGKPVTVTFTPNDYGWGKTDVVQAKTKTGLTAEQFKKMLTVKTLRDTYQ